VGLDKKRRGGKVRVVLLEALGAPRIAPLTLEALTRALDDPSQL